MVGAAEAFQQLFPDAAAAEPPALHTHRKRGRKRESKERASGSEGGREEKEEERGGRVKRCTPETPVSPSVSASASAASGIAAHHTTPVQFLKPMLITRPSVAAVASSNPRSVVILSYLFPPHLRCRL